MSRTHVLIAEDDPASATLLKKYLEAKKFIVSVAENGSEALTRVVRDNPDVVLLDVEMPERDGWQALSEIRSFSPVPVIMVTVRSDTADKVRGLEEGADDYVTKPFDLKEIEVRIRAVLRRGRLKDEDVYKDVFQIGPLTIDDRSKRVRLGDHPIDLSPKQYDLLTLLCSRPETVFDTEEIIEWVWPERDDATAEDVKKYVYFLRNKLAAASEAAHIDAPRIETVRGFGYKMTANDLKANPGT